MKSFLRQRAIPGSFVAMIEMRERK